MRKRVIKCKKELVCVSTCERERIVREIEGKRDRGKERELMRGSRKEREGKR